MCSLLIGLPSIHFISSFVSWGGGCECAERKAASDYSVAYLLPITSRIYYQNYRTERIDLKRTRRCQSGKMVFQRFRSLCFCRVVGLDVTVRSFITIKELE